MKNCYHVAHVTIGELERTLNQFSKDDWKIIKIEQFEGKWVVIGMKDHGTYEEFERWMKGVE